MKFRFWALLSVAVIVICLLSRDGPSSNVNEIFAGIQDKPTAAKKLNRKIRKPALISNKSEFVRWQNDIRSRYIDALNFDFSATPTPELRKVKTETHGGMTREFIEIVAFDGMIIPAVIQYPAGARNLPGILVIPGHTKPGDSGLSQLVDAKESYHNSAATKMAEAGYLTLAIELRGFGLLGPPAYPEHKFVAFNALLSGRAYKSLLLADLSFARQILLTHEIVDNTRIGVAGASFGGELAVALGIIFPTINAITFSSYFEAGNFNGFGPDAKKVPHYCHLIPKLGKFMRREDVFKLLAPRPTLGIRDAENGDKFAPFIKRFSEHWNLFGKSENFEFIVVQQGDHEFYLQESLAFFKKHL